MGEQGIKRLEELYKMATARERVQMMDVAYFIAWRDGKARIVHAPIQSILRGAWWYAWAWLVLRFRALRGALRFHGNGARG